MSKTKLLYYYPIALTTIGIFIHLFGTLGLFQIEGPRSLHVLMLSIDTLVVIGLLKKSKFGYYLAVLLYIEQSIMEPYWGYLSVAHYNSWYQLLVVCPLVWEALAVLVFKKKLFINGGSHDHGHQSHKSLDL